MATDRQTDRRHAKNNFFGLSGPQKVKIHKNLEVDFLGKCNTFSILRIAEKVKTCSISFDPGAQKILNVDIS